MGCDIHTAVFAKYKKSGEYVDLETSFPDLNTELCKVGWDRYYDYFGLFGQTARSSYPIMNCLHDGTPDYFSKLRPYDAECPDWYGFTYCTIDELIKGFSDYEKFLEDLIENGQKKNEKILDESDEDDYSDFYHSESCDRALRKYVKSQRVSVKKNYVAFKKLMNSAKSKILETLNDDAIDPTSITFVFWFDN